MHRLNRYASIATIYAAWQFARSFLHRGWWLVTSLYLVTEAELSALQLVALGTAQGLTVLAAEIPTGVLADTYSRKWSIVAAHAVMGLGMLATGLVTAFPALVVTQMIWGLSWTFSTGADVAWLTDEQNEPEKTGAAVANAAKWGLAGSAFGIVSLGGLAWATSLATAIVLAGAGMWLLGIVVACVFEETRFRRPSEPSGVRAALEVLSTGLQTIRTQRTLVLIIVCTVLVNGADEAFSRLYAKRLVELGLPAVAEPIVWLSLLSIAALGLGVVALSILTKRISRQPDYAGAYIAGAAIGAIALLLFAIAPSAEFALVGVLLASGIAWTVMRTVSVIWANEHATSEVRATVQSFLSLAEHSGEIVIGFSLALVAESAGIDVAMIGSCCVLCVTAFLVNRYKRKTGRATGTE